MSDPGYWQKYEVSEIKFRRKPVDQFPITRNSDDPAALDLTLYSSPATFLPLNSLTTNVAFKTRAIHSSQR